jgi:hypothetical protein
MLQSSLDTIRPFLVNLFNSIFETGEYPEDWAYAIIVPIHKSGDRDNPDNYRGVSLLSILGKAFAYILNKRLTRWSRENDKIVEEQSGFRSGYSTMDNVFVLFAIVQKYLLRRSGKVYICFVDFKKAFDTVDRAILWSVLKESGVGVRILRMLKGMYKTVRSCVRCTDKLTEHFDCPNGVRQGCVLSPTLFSFLVNELAKEVREHGVDGIQLTPDVVQILILLFADDVILASYTARGLQRQLNILKNFSDNFSMTVNLTKTKIVVFRKGGFLKASEKWYYGDEQVTAVNCYKYLGIHFTSRLSLNQSVKELAIKAKAKTSQLFRCLWKLGQIPRDVFFKIYDAQIVPILLYGAELWGYQRYDVIERTHLFACKRFMNVGCHMPNAMIYGDLGRYPMYITSAVRCIKYWFRVVNMPHGRLPKKAYAMLFQLEAAGKRTWAYQVKMLLIDNGFTEVWNQQNVGDFNAFICRFRQTLIDKFKSNWSSSLRASERYDFYSSFKSIFESELYFDYVQTRPYRDAYTRFRLGTSPIQTHALRYRAGLLPRHLLCPMCRQEVEDESHVLFICHAYNDLRNQCSLLTNTTNAQIVMNCKDEISVRHLSTFLFNIFEKRRKVVLALADNMPQ